MLRFILKQKLIIGTLLLLMLLLPMTALANNMNTDQVVSLKADELVNGPGFYSSHTVQLDGTVNGTVFASGQYVVVNGTINGDLLTVGQEVVVNGTITGNLFAAGQTIEVNGQIKGDTFSVGQRVKYSKDSILERDAFAAAQEVNLAGKIQRQLFAAGENVNVQGLIGDKALLHANNLRISDNAQLNGSLTYTSSSQAYIAPSAKIAGPVDWQKVEPKPAPKPVKSFGQQAGWFIFGILGALLIWFLISLWRPAFWPATSAAISTEPLKTLGYGALVLILTPLAAILLLVTIIGIPLGIILGLLYGISIWLSHIVVAVFAGYWLARRFQWPELHKGVWWVLLGLAILALLGELPIVGFLVNLAVILAGLGALVLTLAKPQTTPPPVIPPVFNGPENI